MNTRFLFVISLLIAMFAVWFYRNQGDLDSVINMSTTNIEYEAADILAVQTNEDGIAEYSLTADNLTHYSDQNFDKLVAMKLNWRPNNTQNVTVNADEAVMYHEQSKVVMTNNVLFSSQANENGQVSKPPLKLVASELIGDLEQKKVFSNKPIKVTQAANSFESSKFVADMTTGDYEFSNIAVTFMPPARKDVPLF
ncbi:LPS export ABC transporter periplasmic protein LptC [Psychrobacter sanguinis]|uniref:LPS export ABC transporter periplasmic protein LptC n=1 Tax=Psychrobacter sanguinis TaxID=861445 RepID=UPI0019199B75|nr:LPS export ABC transporter periplasmic protein LptC [Psychrobacter sanguinis]MCC3308167.1 LPS export ABC transporter periplasmic protein LptC [Psychrobacter sanguinis]UEC25445.1 LPS export ABC transporter periplasmic protein LptC [Psychrobacter sanguinis]